MNHFRLNLRFKRAFLHTCIPYIKSFSKCAFKVLKCAFKYYFAFQSFINCSLKVFYIFQKFLRAFFQSVVFQIFKSFWKCTSKLYISTFTSFLCYIFKNVLMCTLIKAYFILKLCIDQLIPPGTASLANLPHVLSQWHIDSPSQASR